MLEYEDANQVDQEPSYGDDQQTIMLNFRGLKCTLKRSNRK